MNMNRIPSPPLLSLTLINYLGLLMSLTLKDNLIKCLQSIPYQACQVHLNREEWIKHFWETIDSASWEPDDSTFIFILSTYTKTLDNTDDGLPLVYPQLIDWDQQEPPILDTFENDEAIVDFLGLHEGIPSGDNKVGFAIELNYATYFGEFVLSSSHKSENEKSKNKNNSSLGEN